MGKKRMIHRKERTSTKKKMLKRRNGFHVARWRFEIWHIQQISFWKMPFDNQLDFPMIFTLIPGEIFIGRSSKWKWNTQETKKICEQTIPQFNCSKVFYPDCPLLRF